jgi:glycine/sarcosine/betaine reductase complex component A
MDLENQKRVLDLSEKFGKENVVVILGTAEAESAGLTAETVSAGDPTFAGPLAGVSLGLVVYHVFELKEEFDAQVYDEQCGMMEMVLDVDALNSEVSSMRKQFSKF